MHLFFNDPRVGYVTRHRRTVRPSLAGLVAGGVGVAALGVVVGAASFEWTPAVPPAASDRGVAMPVATPLVGDIQVNGPLGMGTVPAAPVLEFEAPRSTRSAASENASAKASYTASPRPRRVERTTASAQPSTEPTLDAPATEEPTPDDPATEDPATEDPATEDPETEDPGSEPRNEEPDGWRDPASRHWWRAP
jgi:hypothetical protein